VKEQVYLPDWTTEQRLHYTLSCSRLLAQLLPEGVEGSVSTVPLGYKGFQRGADFLPACIGRLLDLAIGLDQLHDDTGRVVRLAIEPEPCCVLETTAEAIEFFQSLWAAARERDLLDVVQRHLGVCYDVCHQSVEFEEMDASMAALSAAGVRVNKVHITCALRLPRPMQDPAGREALARFVEPRYLHQTLAQLPGGEVLRETDLTPELCQSPPAGFSAAREWRTHFHVPVDAEEIGPLLTTRDDLRMALGAVRRLPYAPHLEVETYTWGVLPGERKPSLVEGLSAELRATRALLGAH
jgi:hypothetical protein